MTAKRFMIASLLAAGFGHTSAAQDRLAVLSAGNAVEPLDSPFEQAYSQDHYFTLAGHRSHSSHSSHRSSSGGSSSGGHYSHTSHTSHRSSTGGGYDYPTYPSLPAGPTYDDSSGSSSSSRSSGTTGTSPNSLYASPSTRPSTGTDSGLPPLSGRSERFKKIVCRVQLALSARDFYPGAIDCVVGPQLRAALRRYQSAHGLTETGTITPEVLDSLMVPTG